MADHVPGGYAGKILRVDLTNERIWTQPWTPEMCRTYLGGVGLGAKILWEEVPPEVHWDHPENRLVMATGPLAGLASVGHRGPHRGDAWRHDQRRHQHAGQRLFRRQS